MTLKPQQSVLVVEDDTDIAQLIELHLLDLGYAVQLCHHGDEALDLAFSNRYEVIVLDLMLPGRDGLSICSELRQKQIGSSILMLTSRNSETDRVVGLELGADDYLTKPFSVRELQARVKALIRRADFIKTTPESTQSDEAIFRFSGLTIDTDKRQVVAHGKAIDLTSTEFDLLIFLAQKPGSVFSRAQLLDAVWGYHHSGYEHTVNSHINRLRTKLEVDPSSPQYVKTVWGVGYKFMEEA